MQKPNATPYDEAGVLKQPAHYFEKASQYFVYKLIPEITTDSAEREVDARDHRLAFLQARSLLTLTSTKRTFNYQNQSSNKST